MSDRTSACEQPLETLLADLNPASADLARAAVGRILPAGASLPLVVTFPGGSASQPVRLWVLEQPLYGLLPVIRRVWGLRGVLV